MPAAECRKTVAQSQGALVYYASLHEKLKSIKHEQSLIIGPGARTFDWLVARGMRFVQKKSHSINRGMVDVLETICRPRIGPILARHRNAVAKVSLKLNGKFFQALCQVGIVETIGIDSCTSHPGTNLPALCCCCSITASWPMVFDQARTPS